MKKVHPENLKEALIMSVPNAATMVLGMVTLNLWIYGVLTPGHFARVVPMMFAVAFSYDFLVVGPAVTRLVTRYNIWRYMPLIRVGIMAATLTFLAPILEAGYIVSARHYFTALPRNYIAALLLQVLIAFPVGMWVLAQYKARRAKK